MSIDNLIEICIAVARLNRLENVLFMTKEEVSSLNESINSRSSFALPLFGGASETYTNTKGYIGSFKHCGVRIHVFDMDDVNDKK